MSFLFYRGFSGVKISSFHGTGKPLLAISMDMTLQIRINDFVTNNQVHLHRQVQLRETRLESQKDG